MGVGQLISEDDLLEGVKVMSQNPQTQSKHSIGVSSVTVK
jgi:hypothetical protein